MLPTLAELWIVTEVGPELPARRDGNVVTFGGQERIETVLDTEAQARRRLAIAERFRRPGWTITLTSR